MTNPVTQIGDAIRGTLLVDRPEQISPLLEAVVRKVRKQEGEFFIKNFWADANAASSSYGYVGIHIKIRMPVFIVDQMNQKKYMLTKQNQKKYILMEIQLHFKAIMNGTLECAKEIAHNLYKAPQEASGTIPPKIIASSQLVYLTAMTRLLASPMDVQSADETVELIRAMTKTDKAMCLFLATALLLHKQDKLGGGDWDDQLQAIVPKNKNAITAAWENTAKTVSNMLKLRSDLPIKPVNIDAWTNTATSVDELLEDAHAMKPFFKNLFDKLKKQQACTPNFGPGDNHMIKEKKSLLTKIGADCVKELQPFQNQTPLEKGKQPPVTMHVPLARPQRDNWTVAEISHFFPLPEEFKILEKMVGAMATNWHKGLARLAQHYSKILPRTIPPLPRNILEILESSVSLR